MSDCVSIVLFAGTLACSRVAKVSVCPQALLALREQTRAFGQETRHALLKKAHWHRTEGSQGAQEEHQDSPTVRLVATFFSSRTPSAMSNVSLVNELTPIQSLSTHVPAHSLWRLGTVLFLHPNAVAAEDVNIIREPGAINSALQQLKHLSLFVSLQKCSTEEPIEPHFRNIVQNMENYLNPLLKQFDISFSR